MFPHLYMANASNTLIQVNHFATVEETIVSLQVLHLLLVAFTVAILILQPPLIFSIKTI